MRYLLLLFLFLAACSSGEEQRLRDENRKLRSEVETLREQIGRHARESRKSLPEAHVLSVQDAMVLISIGRLDGVEPGDEVQIRRGGTYVGAMTVRKVYLDSAVGEVASAPAGPGAPPQSGDTTYTEQ